MCGACADSYGITAPLQCRKCMPTGRQLGLYVLLVSATVVFMAVTVQLTWQDNQQASASLRPSDLIKVLIQYLQYVVILGSMSVPWPPFLRGMFAAASVVFGAASGEALSLDCLLQQHGVSRHKLPLAVQRQLLLYVAAVASYACVVLLLLAAHWVTRVVRSTCRRTRSTRSRAATTSSRVSWGKAVVAVLVLVFFAYPTLVKGGLNFFACVQIDDASKGPHAEYAVLNHPAGYWVSDIQQECFAGWHKQWALGFGIPVVVLSCVGVPLGVWLLLWRNSSRLGHPGFRQYCGFLYRNYTESKAWWEAVWAVQTALLTAVSVFYFTLQAYNAVLGMGMLLLTSAALQGVARPYAQPRLHCLHMAATACLLCNVWCALALFSDVTTPSHARWHTAVGAMIVAVNTVFVAWCRSIVAVAALPVLKICAAAACKAPASPCTARRLNFRLLPWCNAKETP